MQDLRRQSQFLVDLLITMNQDNPKIGWHEHALVSLNLKGEINADTFNSHIMHASNLNITPFANVINVHGHGRISPDAMLFHLK